MFRFWPALCVVNREIYLQFSWLARGLVSSYSTRQPSASTNISPGQAAKRSPRLCSTGAFKDKPGACLTSSQPPLSSNPSNPLKHHPGGIYYENDTEPQLFGELFGLRFTHGLHVSSVSPWHVLALLRFKSHKLGKKKDASAGCLNPYTISAQAQRGMDRAAPA